MTDPLRKRRPMDEADRLLRPDGDEFARSDANAADAIRNLQQQAGNTAVAGMLGGTRAPTGPAGKQTPAVGDGFEADLFDRSILEPMRSLYAVVRDSPPDPDLALEKLQPIGEALLQYEQRYRGKDDALANAFYAARGWLGPAVDELRRRTGTGKVRPWTDDQITTRIQESLEDLAAVRARLR
jgi:hypothetical protein